MEFLNDSMPEFQKPQEEYKELKKPQPRPPQKLELQRLMLKVKNKVI